MFCNEVIKEVYWVMNECFSDWEDCFLDCYQDMAFHVKKGYRLLLKTESYYISLGFDGVKLISVNDDPLLPDEYMEACVKSDGDEVPWVEFEHTLFAGERLIEVREQDGRFIAVFDDFTLKIIPYEIGQQIERHHNESHWAYNHVYGCERLIKRKCDCGGTGELFLDFVTDYIVRCNQCKKSTWAGMNAIDAIEDWNAGDTPCDSRGITIE